VDQEQETLRQVFLWLLTRYRNARGNLSGKRLEIHDLVCQRYEVFQDADLEKSLATEEIFDCLDHKKFLILEPVSLGTWMLPVLSFGYDFKRSHPEFDMRVALFLFETLGDKDTLRAIGYRFESPEGEGSHHFYHAQIIRAFQKDNEQMRLPGPEWLPTKQPSFALDAKSPTTLLACLLITLYGRSFIHQLQQARFWTQIQSSVDSLMSSDRSFQPSYWSMTVGKNSLVYKTWEKKPKFKQIMKDKEKALAIEEISLETYAKQPANKRRIF
jgi:hypothetical protein